MIKVTFPAVVKLSDKLSKHELIKDVDFIVGISRGGLIVAAIIATSLNKPLITAYIDKEDNVFLDRPDWLYGKKVLIIDDACRTGKTIMKIDALVVNAGATSIIKFVLYKHQKVENIEINSIKEYTGSLLFPWDKNDESLNRKKSVPQE